MKSVTHHSTLHLSFKIKCCIDRLRPPSKSGNSADTVDRSLISGTIGTLPVDLFFMYYEYMARKQRGRPATGQDPVTAVRLPPELKSKVGAWANRRKDKPSLSKAIRQLLEKALGGTVAPRQRSQGARKATDMAAREIDRLSALGGAAITLPLSARAQQPERMRRIGVLFGFDKNDPEAEEYSRAMLRTAVAEC
jgi:hypothetical protein